MARAVSSKELTRVKTVATAEEYNQRLIFMLASEVRSTFT